MTKKLSREKTVANFKVLWLFTEVFSVKFGDVASFGGTSKQSTKVFSVKILFSTNSQNISPTKFSCYTVLLIYILTFLLPAAEPLVRISTHFSNGSLPNTTPALPTPNNASWITRGRSRGEGSAPDYVTAIKFGTVVI